jgi:hypothetical protein
VAAKGGRPFAERPQINQKPKRAPIVNKEVSKVMLHTNQFRVKMSGEQTVYLYSMAFEPENLDSYLIEKAVNLAERQLAQHFSVFATSGQLLFASNLLEKDIEITSQLEEGFEVKITISPTKARAQAFNELDCDDGEINQVISQIMATTLKKAFKAHDMHQVGKQPRFFDMNNFRQIEAGRDGEILQLFPGYKATTWLYGQELFINIDSVTKFIP